MNEKKRSKTSKRKMRAGFSLRGILAIILSMSLIGMPLGSLVSVSAASISAATDTQRLGGSDRYATAAQISQAGWPEISEYAVLAAGMDENLVDALTAAPLAAKLQAPILLTEGILLNNDAKAELIRLGVKTVYVTSGTGVITQPVLDRLSAMGITVKSLGGADRFETAVNMAKELQKLGGAISKIVVTTGANNADALSVASIAAAKGMPILLTNHSELPHSVKAFLDGLTSDVANSYVIGGTGVVGNTVQGLLPGEVKRYAGTTRYETNLEVLKNFANDLKYQATYVANGEDASMADALAGAPLAAQNASPILLTNQKLSASAKDYAKLNLAPKVVALGGEGVVPAKVISDLTSSTVLDETGMTKGGSDATQPERLTDNLKITADNVTLKNVSADYSIYVQGDKATLSQVKVRGTVFLNPGEQGTVDLDGVSAARVVVLSGANNSIHLKNVTTDALNVASSTPVRVETSGATSVASTVVSSAAILDAVAGSFGKVEIAKLALAATTPDPANPSVVEAVVELRGNFTEAVTVSGQASVKAAANAKIPQMNIAPESKEQKITLQGTFQTVNINKAGEVALAENTKVTSTIVNSGAILNAVSGSFGQVEIAKTITGGTVNGSATPGKAPVMPIVELRGTFDQKVLVCGQATVKAALNANISKVEIAPERVEQKIILDGTFAKVEVNKEAKVELSEHATVKDAVTNVKAEFKIPEGASVEKLDPKETGTTASGGGDVNGTTTSKDTTTPPVAVAPPVTNLPATGGNTGGSGGDGGGQIGVQTITVSPVTTMNLTVGNTGSTDVTTSPTDATVSAVSNDSTVATVSVNGHVLTVTATQKAGSATITVTASKSGYTSGTSAFTVSVIPGKPAAFDLGAQKGSLYISLSGFQDQYYNKITWADLTSTYGIDMQSSKVYLTTADNTTSTVFATLEQLMSRRVATAETTTPSQIVSALSDGGTGLHLTDADLAVIGAGTGTLVAAGGETMFSGFNLVNDKVVYADISGTFGGVGGIPWEIKNNCALPDLSVQSPVTPDTTAPVLTTPSPSTAPAAANITVANNTGAADTVTVSGLAAGDTVTAYDAATAGTPLGTGIVATGTTLVTLNSLTLTTTAGSVWVSVRNSGKAESARTEKTYAAEASAPSSSIVYVNASLSAEDSTHFKTVNAAVQAVADGGTIEVAAGTYAEMVKNYYQDSNNNYIYKSFTLQGPDWTGQTKPLAHIQPPLLSIDPSLNYGHVIQADGQSGHPKTVNVKNLWLDGSLGIVSNETKSAFIRGITLGYYVNGSITGNLVTGTGDGIYVLGGDVSTPVTVTIENNQVEQLAYDSGTVGSALVVLAAQATVSNNTLTGLNGAPVNGLKLYYKLKATISGNTFKDFGPANMTANAMYGGAKVSSDTSPMGYALNLTSYVTADSLLTISGNTFTNVQGILADDRASGNLSYADFAVANTVNGSWLAYGDKTRIHWLSDTQDPNQLNYVLMDSVLLNMTTPQVWLKPGTYTMTRDLVDPGKTVILNSITPTPAAPDVTLQVKYSPVPAHVVMGSGVNSSVLGL